MVKKRMCTQDNIKELKEMLGNCNWDDVMNTSKCQEAYSKFNEIVNGCYDANCPYKDIMMKKKNRKPWVTIGIKKSIKYKYKLFHLYKTTNTVYNEIQYKLYKS